MSSYITLLKESEIRFVERKSVFIGYARPVKSEEECTLFLSEIKGKNKTATHNVYAYIVNDNGMLMQKYSDDGEPQGTAGLPVLDVLRKQDISNCIVVVTRYYGGIQLGASGLVRAYSKSASLVVSDAGICNMVLCVPITINLDYHFYGKVQNQMAEAKSFEPRFGTEVSITYIVPEEEVLSTVELLNNITNGKNLISYGVKEFFPMT